jgi:hypothetical protein
VSSLPPKVTTGLVVAGSAAALLFASSFVNAWGRVSVRAGSLGEAGRLPATITGFDAWQGFGPVLAAALVSSLLVVAAVPVVLLVRRIRARPGVVLLLSLLMSSLFVAGVAPGPDLDGAEHLDGVEVSTGVLVITGYALCAAAALGAFAHVRSARRRS